MPFVKEETPRPVTIGIEPPDEPDAPSFFQEVLPAAWRTENLAGSILSNPTITTGPRADFDPFENPEDLKGYEDHAEAFAFAASPEQVQRLKARIDRERNDRDVLSRAGLPGFIAAMGAGIVDPTVFIPVAGQVGKGQSVFRATGRVAAAAGYSTAIQEVGLQASQYERTLAESAFNVGGSVLLGGLLGGGVHALSKADFTDLARRLETDMRMPKDGEPDMMEPAQSLSAAAVKKTSIDDEGIAAVEGAAKVASIHDPTLRLATSPSRVARLFGQSMAEGSLALRKNLPEVAEDGTVRIGQPTTQAVESAIRRKQDVFVGRSVNAMHDAYVKYRFGKERKLGDLGKAQLKNLLKQTDGKLTQREFEAKVHEAMNRGDASEIPEVAEAAAKIRPYIETLKNEARDLGMFGMEVANPDRGFGEAAIYRPAEPSVAETADSYMPFIHDKQKIIRNPEKFDELVAESYRRMRDESAARVQELEFYLTTTSRPEIEALRSQAFSWIKARRSLFQKGQNEIEKAKRADAKAKGRKAEAGTQARAADKRVDATTVNELPPEKFAYYRGLQRDLQRGRGDYQYESLTDFVRKNGGIKDWDTLGSNEFQGMDYRKKKRIINTRDGRGIDYMREAAVEEGYIDEDLNLDGFGQLLVDDANGIRKTYRQVDLDAVAYDEWLQEVAEDLSRAKVDETNLEELASWFEAAEYAKANKYQKGRLKEAELRERYAYSRLDKATAAAEDRDMLVHEARMWARSLGEHAPDITKRINETRKELKSAVSERNRLKAELRREGLRADATDAELKAVAARTRHRILSGPNGRLSYDSAKPQSKGGRKREPGLGSPFHSRKLKVHYEKMREFLVDDMEVALRSLSHTMVPDIELMKRFGSIDMELQFKMLTEDFDNLSAQIGRELETLEKQGKLDEKAKLKAAKRREELDSQRRQAERDILGIRDRLRGVYGVPEDPTQIGYRLLRGVQNVNVLTKMHGVTVSSFPDVARMVFFNGLENLMPVANKAFTKGLSDLKAPMEDLKAAGSALEYVTNSRSLGMYDILDDYGRGTKTERALDEARNRFGFVNLITPWNHAMKSMAGLTTQNRILKAVEQAYKGRISKKDATFLARLGIGEEDAKAMAREYRRVGLNDDGLRSANTSEWSDSELAEKYLNALRKVVDQVIVTPGQEKPFMASGPIGRMIFQFRNYNFAATQRVSLAMAQGMAMGDASALMAMITQISLGMMVGGVKAAQNRVDTSEWEARRWIVEGVDRSGILGVLSDYNVIAEHATRGRLGLSALAGQGMLTRYYSRSGVGALLGPTFGGAQDLMSVTGAIASGDVRESDLMAARRILPFGGMIGVRELFEEAARANDLE